MQSCPETQQWVVQPLLDAGVDPEEVGHLVVRLAFTVLVSEGRDTLAGLRDVVADRSLAVQAAWTEVLSRMFQLEP